MSEAAERVRQAREALAELEAGMGRAVQRLLEAAGEVSPGDGAAAAELLAAAEVVGRGEQAAHGRLVLVLAQADRVGAAPGGVKAWVAARLDVSEGRARGIAQAARRIGAVPQLAGPLAGGGVGADTVRVLARAAKAVAGTGRDEAQVLGEVLETAGRAGVGAARRRVRELEHALDPGSSDDLLARQRARSFLRVVELEDGLCRFEVVLDPVRATVVRSAIDGLVADWIRRAQFDRARAVPGDVCSVEQMGAQALTRLAQVFIDAPARLRESGFSPSVLFFTPLEGGLARSVYGDVLPGSHLLQVDHAGRPVAVDGQEIDADPGARLASPPQRIALAFRDRGCTYPGCGRPTTWSLHAHHRTPYSRGGQTTLGNLTLLCPQHHTLVHRQHTHL